MDPLALAAWILSRIRIHVEVKICIGVRIRGAYWDVRESKILSKEIDKEIFLNVDPEQEPGGKNF
jgi:hypothetical protein